MARKRFHFDFNEDAEPVEELHRLRVAMMEHFKTFEAIQEYLRSTPTAEEFLSGLDAEEEKTKLKTPKRRKAASAGTQRVRRKPTKRPVHA